MVDDITFTSEASANKHLFLGGNQQSHCCLADSWRTAKDEKRKEKKEREGYYNQIQVLERPVKCFQIFKFLYFFPAIAALVAGNKS